MGITFSRGVIGKFPVSQNKYTEFLDCAPISCIPSPNEEMSSPVIPEAYMPSTNELPACWSRVYVLLGCKQRYILLISRNAYLMGQGQLKVR